jgi:hypothetical protein
MSFWQSKTTIRKTDRKFSRYIRGRDRDCVARVRCLGQIPFKNLTCAHFISRRTESTRFDQDNCVTLCRACHLFLDDHMDEFSAIMKERLGERGFNLLLIRSETKVCRDDALDELYIDSLLASLPQDSPAHQLQV